MKNKKKTATLIKVWDHNGFYREKIIYQGTLRGAKKRIPPSKKEQFRIVFTQ